MLKERQVFLCFFASETIFSFAFPFFSIFPEDKYLRLWEDWEISGGCFILDIVPFPSHQGHTFPLPQSGMAQPAADTEGNLSQVSRTLFTQGQICANRHQVKNNSLYRSLV